MLPDAAKTHFDNLIARQSADAWHELSEALDAERRAQLRRGLGGTPSSSSFWLLMAVQYKKNFAGRTTAIFEVAKKVHADFDRPLEEGVEGRLKHWAGDALSKQFQSMEGAFTRDQQRMGQPPAFATQIDMSGALATLHTAIDTHLWELRTLPVNKAAPLSPSASFTFNNSTIGAVQTGTGAVAHVEQQWIQGDSAALQAALSHLSEALDREQECDAEMRQALVGSVEKALAELRAEKPRRSMVLLLLGGLGTAIQVLPNIAPAWNVVRGGANAIGVHLP